LAPPRMLLKSRRSRRLPTRSSTRHAMAHRMTLKRGTHAGAFGAARRRFRQDRRAPHPRKISRVPLGTRPRRYLAVVVERSAPLRNAACSTTLEELLLELHAADASAELSISKRGQLAHACLSCFHTRPAAAWPVQRSRRPSRVRMDSSSAAERHMTAALSMGVQREGACMGGVWRSGRATLVLQRQREERERCEARYLRRRVLSRAVPPRVLLTSPLGPCRHSAAFARCQRLRLRLGSVMSRRAAPQTLWCPAE
jgi:hypothetical protein